MTDAQNMQPARQPTVLTDIDIPFGRLVAIMIKFGLAAIPAAIIIGIIWGIILLIITLIFGAGMWGTGMFQHMNDLGGSTGS